MDENGSLLPKGSAGFELPAHIMSPNGSLGLLEVEANGSEALNPLLEGPLIANGSDGAVVDLAA